MSLNDWNDRGGEGNDIPTCVDCGARVDGPKYGPPVGIFQCIACAIGEVLEKEPPKPRLCYCGAELTGMGVVCEPCEQKAITATCWMAGADWAQPEGKNDAELLPEPVGVLPGMSK